MLRIGREEFQTDVAVIACRGDCGENICIVKFSCTWLMASRDVSDMIMADKRRILPQVGDHVALRNLLMVDVEQHLDILRIHFPQNLCSFI